MPNTENPTSFIQWKDIKNVQNRTVYSFGLIIQKMRSEVTKLINAEGEQALEFLPYTFAFEGIRNQERKQQNANNGDNKARCPSRSNPGKFNAHAVEVAYHNHSHAYKHHPKGN